MQKVKKHVSTAIHTCVYIKYLYNWGGWPANTQGDICPKEKDALSPIRCAPISPCNVAVSLKKTKQTKNPHTKQTHNQLKDLRLTLKGFPDHLGKICTTEQTAKMENRKKLH